MMFTNSYPGEWLPQGVPLCKCCSSFGAFYASPIQPANNCKLCMGTGVPATPVEDLDLTVFNEVDL